MSSFKSSRNLIWTKDWVHHFLDQSRRRDAAASAARSLAACSTKAVNPSKKSEHRVAGTHTEAALKHAIKGRCVSMGSLAAASTAAAASDKVLLEDKEICRVQSTVCNKGYQYVS